MDGATMILQLKEISFENENSSGLYRIGDESTASEYM